MNKQRKTSHILNVFQYDADGHVVLPASLALGIAPTGEDNSAKVPTTAWVRSIIGTTGASYVPTGRTITINGTSYDLSSNRSWSIDTGVLTASAGSGISVSVVSQNLNIVNTGLLTATSGSGISVSTVNQNLNIVNTGLLTATAGAGISVSTVSQNLNIVNTGLLTATAGSGITVSVVNQNLNVVNTGILTASAGSGISLTVVGQNLNVVNTGVLTASAGAGISLSIVDGNLNVVNTITNNNQLTNGAAYITSSALTGYATETYVGTQISNLVDAAPGTLDTLNELAAALGDDPNFATTVSTSIGTKVPQTRTLTINGTSYDLTANRSWTINSMVYPSAGIALSTGTAWGTSITDNSANWNTAYGWGNHASAGYAASSHTHSIANVTGLQTALDGKQASGSYAASSHSHIISDVTGLQTALDGKQASLGYTPYNATNPNGYITGISFANVSSKPTTISGYGITDAITTGNIASQSVSYASSTNLLNSLSNYVWSASTLPSGYNAGIQTSFVSASEGFPSYGSVLTNRTYTGSEGGTLQLFTPYGPAYGGTRLGFRSGIYETGAWSGWKYLLNDSSDPYAANMNQYVRTTDNVNFNTVTISGKITTAVTNGTIISHGSMTDAFGYNNSYGTYIGSAVGGTYYIYGNGQMYNNGTIVTLYHTGNIPTWNQNTTGTAGSISGYNNPTAAATANTIVYRDGSGHITGNYILGSYFNSSAGNSENPTIGQIWTQSTGDNYLRKSTPAHLISQLGLVTGGSSPTFTEVYADNWFRNNGSNEGLYNQVTTQHLSSNTNGYWDMSSTTSVSSIRFYTGGHMSALRGYVYANTSNEIGFLNSGGSWGLRMDNNYNVQIYGQLTVGSGTSSDIYMTDTDESTRRIHTNSGRIGFLNTSNNWGAYCDNSGNWFSDHSMRAPIFYDSNDTTYYLDPNSSTALFSNGVVVAGNQGFQSRFYANGRNRIWSFYNSDNYGISYFQGGPDYIGLHFGNPTQAASQFWVSDSGIAQASGSMRAPIFYDSNDTAYYLNPAGGSRLRNLYVGDSGDDWSDPGGWGTQVRFSNGPHVRFVLHARSPGIEAGMYVHTPGSVYIGSYTSHDVSMMYAGNRKMQITNSYIYTDVYLEAAGSLRAPIFYDSNDTGYYGDFASTSRMNNIILGSAYTPSYQGQLVLGHTSYNFNFLNGSWASSVTAGILANCADEYEFAIHDSGNSVESLFIYQSSTGRILMGRDIGWGSTPIQAAADFRAPQFRFTNSGNSAYFTGDTGWGARIYTDSGYIWFGPANSSYAHIYTDRGQFYFNADILINGTSLVKNDGGSYGISISGNAGSVGGYSVSSLLKLNEWNGNVYLHTDGRIYGTIFYDANNDGYYLNPNGTSSIVNLHVQGGGYASNAWSSSSGNEAVRVYAPGGASASWDGGITGAFRIKLPQRANNTMWSMTVRIYNYSTNQTAEYTMGNYSYDQGGYNSSAHFIGAASAPVYNVRFGNQDGVDCVWIGETSTSWSYPVVSVIDFQGGFRSGNASTWDDGWNITYVTSFGTVATTIYPSVKFGNVNAGDIGAASVSASNVYASSDVRGNDVYTTGGWFRNHTNSNGIYWSSTGWHLYPKDGSDFYLRSGSSDASIQFMRGGTASNYIHNASDNAIGFLSTGRSWILRVDNSGNTTASGDVTAYSDKRLKSDITPINDALEKVLKLNGVSYKRIDLEDKSTKIGFIAQDVKEIVPEVVSVQADTLAGINDRHSIDYGKMVALLTEAIKEQQKQIEELQNKLDNVLSSR